MKNELWIMSLTSPSGWRKVLGAGAGAVLVGAMGQERGAEARARGAGPRLGGNLKGVKVTG